MTVVDLYLKCDQLKHDCNIIVKEGSHYSRFSAFSHLQLYIKKSKLLTSQNLF